MNKLGVPVITGWDSEDLMCDDDPLYVGRAGKAGRPPGNFAIQNSDLVLSIGSRLSIRQVGYNYGTWARAAYVIVNDIDEEELKKPSVHSDMRIHGDARDLLEQMDKVLDELLTVEEGRAGGEAAGKPFFDGGQGLAGMKAGSRPAGCGRRNTRWCCPSILRMVMRNRPMYTP